jgi:hypothetical protein
MSVWSREDYEGSRGDYCAGEKFQVVDDGGP